jgi:hypothetical protein
VPRTKEGKRGQPLTKDKEKHLERGGVIEIVLFEDATALPGNKERRIFQAEYFAIPNGTKECLRGTIFNQLQNTLVGTTNTFTWDSREKGT